MKRRRALLLFLSMLLLPGSLLAVWSMQRNATPPAPAAGQVALGAHALVGQEEERADAVARTPPLRTDPRGSSLLAVVAGYVVNDAAPTDSFGNRWRRLGKPVVYRGYEDRFDVRAYWVPDARGGDGHVVEVDKRGRPAGELTLVAVEARNAGRLVDIAQTYPGPALQQHSGSVTTDGPALLVAMWWGDGADLRHAVQPGEGFRVIERFTTLPPNSAVQSVVAVREVDRAGTYRASWYAYPRQGAVLWLMAFASRADARDAK